MITVTRHFFFKAPGGGTLHFEESSPAHEVHLGVMKAKTAPKSKTPPYMTRSRLRKLAALFKKATPGPWAEDDCNIFSRWLADARHAAIMKKLGGAPYNKDHISFDAFIASTKQRTDYSDDDAAFITAAKNEMEALLADARLVQRLLVEPTNGDRIFSLLRARGKRVG